MKTYKELTKNIMEAEDTPAGGYSRSAHSHYGVHRVENPDQLNRLNSFIHNYFQDEVQDKTHAVIGLRQKLNQVGLDFDFTAKNRIPVGEDFKIPLTRYGGTFGTSPQHDLLKNGFEITDGLETPLTLNINCGLLDNGLYNINAKIAPTENVTEGTEDPEHEYDEELNGTNIGEAGEVDEEKKLYSRDYDMKKMDGRGKKKEDKKEVPLVKLGQGDYSKEYYGTKAGKIRLRPKK